MADCAMGRSGQSPSVLATNLSRTSAPDRLSTRDQRKSIAFFLR